MRDLPFVIICFATFLVGIAFQIDSITNDIVKAIDLHTNKKAKTMKYDPTKPLGQRYYRPDVLESFESFYGLD